MKKNGLAQRVYVDRLSFGIILDYKQSFRMKAFVSFSSRFLNI